MFERAAAICSLLSTVLVITNLSAELGSSDMMNPTTALHDQALRNSLIGTSATSIVNLISAATVMLSVVAGLGATQDISILTATAVAGA